MTTKTIRQFFPLLCVLACLAYGIDAQIINEFPNGAVTLNSAQNISGVKNFTATPTLQCGTEPSPLASQKYVDMTAAESRQYTDTLATAAALAYHPRLGSTTLDFKAARLYSTVGTTTNRVADVTDLELAKQGALLEVFGNIGTGTWVDLGTQFSQTAIRSIAAFKYGIVLAGTGGGGLVLRSTDYGATWVNRGQLGTATNTWTVFCSNKHAGVAIAATSNGLYRSSDYGISWTAVIATGSYASIAENDSGSIVCYSINRGKMLYSVDSGSTWLESDYNNSVTVFNFAIVTAENNRFITALDDAGLDSAIVYSDDGGVTWATATTAIPIARLAYFGNGVVVAISQNSRVVWRSVDNGLTWASVQTLAGVAQLRSIAYTSAGTGLIGTGDGGDVFRSTDNGVTWVQSADLTPGIISCLCHIGNGVVLAGTSPNGKILRSTVTLSPYDALTQWLADGSREVRIATSTDAGDYKLQVNGNVYISATCSAAAFEDRSAAPDTVADAYAIVQSHEAKNGHVDHSKLHPKLWGTKPVQVSSKQVEKQVAVRDTEGKETEEFETITVQEPVIEIVPDQSKRNLSMLISAQSEVLKDIDRRLKALENNK